MGPSLAVFHLSLKPRPFLGWEKGGGHLRPAEGTSIDLLRPAFRERRLQTRRDAKGKKKRERKRDLLGSGLKKQRPLIEFTVISSPQMGCIKTTRPPLSFHLPVSSVSLSFHSFFPRSLFTSPQQQQRKRKKKSGNNSVRVGVMQRPFGSAASCRESDERTTKISGAGDEGHQRE
jgi:hypothetical protein